MAFTVKSIKALLAEAGVAVEKLDAVAEDLCSRHNTVLDSIKEERDGYKKDAEQLPDVQKELDELKAKPADGYKEKYEKEHRDFEDFKKATADEKTLEAKKAAFRDLCKDAGLNEKGVAKAIKYQDWGTVELDEAGAIKGAKDQIKALREEWAEHIVSASTQGARTATPPHNSGKAKMTLADLYKTDDKGRLVMSDEERQSAIAEMMSGE